MFFSGFCFYRTAILNKRELYEKKGKRIYLIYLKFRAKNYCVSYQINRINRENLTAPAIR